MDYFRSYDYGFIHRGVCLWWAILGDGRLHIAREYVHRYTPIPDICLEIRRITRDLKATVRYTVADKYSMGSRHSDDTSETRAHRFAAFGVPVVKANHDRHQGWTRIREHLVLRPDGFPWLTIDPSCRYLIRTMSSAVSRKTDPEDVEENEHDHALSALRYGIMSRPSPRHPSMPPLGPHTAGALLREIQRPPSRRRVGFFHTI